MRKGFKILITGGGKNLHLDLLGDFSDSSADQLAQALFSYAQNGYRIVVSTSGLAQINSHGCRVFRRKMANQGLGPPKVWFTGFNAEVLAPKGGVFYQ